MKYLKQVILFAFFVSLSTHASDYGVSTSSLIGNYSTTQNWEVNLPSLGLSNGLKLNGYGQEPCPITGRPSVGLPLEEMGNLSLKSCFSTEPVTLSEELSLDIIKSTFSFSTLSVDDNI